MANLNWANEIQKSPFGTSIDKRSVFWETPQKNTSSNDLVQLMKDQSRNPLNASFSALADQMSEGVDNETTEDVYTPIDEPLFHKAWHLNNNGRNGGKKGEDINVLPVWDQGLSGKGNIIGIIDSAVDINHPDLAPNHRLDLSYDFVYDDDVPWSEATSDSHGTAVAGLAVACDNNVGTVGVAYGAHFASLRLFGGFSSNADAFRAITHNLNAIGIYNISWGYRTEGLHFESIPDLVDLSFERGVSDGRNGNGAIYVVAAGNDRTYGSMTNYYGLNNSPYTITVGAVDSLGFYSSYSNPGSSLFVCAPGSGTLVGTVTTDASGEKGYSDGDYMTNFGGTSASAPIVSGVIALMLEANPSLGWRDVQHVLANSVFPIDHFDEDWQINGGGFYVNHNYGFGRVDATAAVALARRWENVPDAVELEASISDLDLEIPDEDEEGIESTISVASDLEIENVSVTIESDHAQWGDLRIKLVSPFGTISELARPHQDPIARYTRWSFSSVFHWGENARGDWKLIISDERTGGVGFLNGWKISFSGTEMSEDRNSRPSVNSEEFVIDRDGENFVVDILANDSDPDGDSFGPVSFYQPSKGTLQYNELGELTYTPDDDFVALDYFGYTVTDSKGLAGKTVSLIYDPTPFARDDQIVTTVEKPVSFFPLGNDSDLTSDDLVLTNIANANNGDVTINETGHELTYTPEAGFRGVAQFEYIVSDNKDGEDVGLVNAFVTENPDFAQLLNDPEDSMFVLRDDFNPATGFCYEIELYPFSYGHLDGGLGVILSDYSIVAFLMGDLGEGVGSTIGLLVSTEENGSVQYTVESNVIQLDEWQHLALTYEPGIGLKCYVNGVERSIYPLDDGVGLDPGTIHSGGSTVLGNIDVYSSFAFQGLIDDFRVWDTSRTPAQIRESVEHPTNSAEITLLGHWSMDSGTGMNLIDSSENPSSFGFNFGGVRSPRDEDLITYQRNVFLK